ncbi:MAG TPA: LysM peptidoglycan-binding domain-containing protein [Candidatus Doudnabacteria bacterium]|nr:LysM peptidoglycan-binding domain-containing protein [Candidatus Doudnabacteria bacterium]
MKRYWFISQYLFKKLLHSLKAHYPSLSKRYTDHHPAVQLNQKLSGWDYSVSFSSEILVGAIVLAAAGLNVVLFNPLSADYTHRDNSLASQLLRNHTNLNPQLADRQNIVSTKIANSSIFSQASANDYNETGKVLGDSTELENISAEVQIDDTGITKPNPDSIKSLVARQVIIYETKPFDTVYTVAEQFGISTQTIRQTNSLPNNALLAGWHLVIPPVDGLVIQVTNPNLTLTDVANKYSADINKIVSYNGLADAEDMVDIDGYLIVPGGTVPQPKVPAPTPKRVTPAIPRATSIAGNHKFAPGYCTDYVARKVPGITWGGNANRWIANSKAHGATVNRNPVPGAILVTSENNRYGHVAYIESVSGSQVTFSEWNYKGLYVKTVRTLDMSDKRILGVIHPK